MSARLDGEELETRVRDYFVYFERFLSRDRAERLKTKGGDWLDDWLMHHVTRKGHAPEEAWSVVLELIIRAPTKDALAFVISGPVSDLVRRHGEQFADRIIDGCRRDAAIRSAIASVYTEPEVPPALRARLAGVIESNDPRHSRRRR